MFTHAVSCVCVVHCKQTPGTRRSLIEGKIPNDFYLFTASKVNRELKQKKRSNP
jgi:hypothetical protein